MGLGVEAAAQAMPLDSASRAVDSAVPSPPIEWGMRLNGGLGVGALSGSTDGAFGWRAGVDAEYWFSRSFGAGLQVAYQGLATVDFCGGDCSSARVARTSIAPSLAFRGRNPANFPMVSLALGLAWGHVEMSYSCDPSPVCSTSFSDWARDTWGPYGSLTAAWVFHPGDLRPDAMAFAIGPLFRVDCFSLKDTAASAPNLAVLGWSFTTGITIGFGVTGAAPR
jgi:hypothetical protein